MLVGFREPVDDSRHVAQTQPAAVGLRPEGELFVFLAPIGLADRAKEDLAALGPHRTARQVERRSAHGVGDLIERQTMSPERDFGHLDGDFVRRRVDEVDLSDLRNHDQLIAYLLRYRLQRERVEIAGDRDVHDLVAARE